MQFGFSDVLILFYLWVAWSWNLPPDSTPRRFINRVSRIVQWCGLWHDWKMFAPNPPRFNSRVFVRVDYSDGTRREWRPPSTAEVGWWQAFLYARVRKFTEHVARGKPATVRVSLAYYVLVRLSAMELNAVPTSVEIVDEIWPICIDPAATGPAPPPAHKVIYREELTQEKLQ
jgi:hypothetical protein